MTELLNESDIAEMLYTGIQETLVSCARFPTGVCHRVFDVSSGSGRRYVVRVALPENAHLIDGSLYWTSVLRPLGIPLPQVYFHGDFRGCRYTILERFGGTDLGNVYLSLTADERRAIARSIRDIQARMQQLPIGTGYGHACSYAGPYTSPTWSGFIEAMLNQAARRMSKAGLVDGDVVGPVRERASRFAEYFATVRARPFLDDLTMRNVLIEGGRMSGIVDVDAVCFGDRLLQPGLTRMAVLDEAWPEDYVEELCDSEGVGRVERRAMRFYTLLFSVGFLGELGQSFSGNRETKNDHLMVERRMSRYRMALEQFDKDAG